MKIKFALLFFMGFILGTVCCKAQGSRFPPSDSWTEDTMATAGKNIKAITRLVTERLNDTLIKDKAFVEVMRYNHKGKPVLDSLNFSYRIVKYRADDETLQMEKYVNKNERVYTEVFYNEKGIKTSRTENHGRAKVITYFNEAGDETKWVFLKDSIKTDSGRTKYSTINNGHTIIALEEGKNGVSDSSVITRDDAKRITSSYMIDLNGKEDRRTTYTYSPDGKLTEMKYEGTGEDGAKYSYGTTFTYDPPTATGDSKTTLHYTKAGETPYDKVITKNKKGQVLEDSDPNGKQKFYYTNDKLTKKETYIDDVLAETNEYTYDANGVLQNIKTTAKNQDTGQVHTTLYTYVYEYY